MRLLIATTNPGKLREFSEMLATENLIFTNLSSFPGFHEVEETGSTFAENAALKAAGYARQTNQWTLADDSGLCVDALDGGPGIYSARWAQRHGRRSGDAANNQLLLEQLQNTPDSTRTAHFTCALALCNPEGQIILSTQAEWPGQILRQPRGHNGFGYDPLFLIPSLSRTAAELTPEEKSRLSHRGQALRRLHAQLRMMKFE